MRRMRILHTSRAFRIVVATLAATVLVVGIGAYIHHVRVREMDTFSFKSGPRNTGMVLALPSRKPTTTVCSVH